MEKDKKVTALYCRLSKDDGSNSESLSIRTHYVIQVWNLCAVCAQIMRAAGCSLFKRERSPAVRV